MHMLRAQTRKRPRVVFMAESHALAVREAVVPALRQVLAVDAARDDEESPPRLVQTFHARTKCTHHVSSKSHRTEAKRDANA